MESLRNSRICRCCASEGTFKDVKTSYQWMGQDEVYAEMLKDCFDIVLTSIDDTKNGGICEVCVTQLRNAVNFKKQVIQTEEQFKRILAEAEDNLMRTPVVKIEKMKDDDGNDSDTGNDFNEDFSTDYEVPIKEEEVIAMDLPKKRSAKASTSKTKKTKTGESKRQPETMDTIVAVETEIEQNKIETESVDGSEETVLYQKHLDNLKEILDCTNATMIRRYGRIGYACYFCKNEYTKAADLKKHNLEVHGSATKKKFIKRENLASLCVKLDITELKCKLCSKKIDTLEELLIHLLKAHKRNVYTDIDNQIFPFKFNTDSLDCCICLSTFHSFQHLLIHMNIHYRNFVCEICENGYINKSKLRNHKHTHVHGEYKCHICSKVFVTHAKKIHHIQRVHFKVNHFKCKFCSEKFPHHRKRDKHIHLVHGIQMKKVKCQACDKIFSNQNAWMMHTRRIHLMEKKYKCTECDMQFFTSSNLVLHQTKHTKEKKFQCDICLKSYATKKILYEHMRIHANDRRFKCEHCAQSFIQKICWKGHMRAKHGEIV